MNHATTRISLIVTLVVLVGALSVHAAITDNIVDNWNFSTLTGNYGGAFTNSGCTLQSGSGKIGDGYQCAGSNTGSDPKMSRTISGLGTSTWTLAYWVKLGTATAGTTTQLKETASWGHLSTTWHDSKLSVDGAGGSAGNYRVVYTNGTLGTGTWYFVVAQWDKGNNTLSIWINDGQYYNSTSAPSWGSVSDNFWVGAGFNGYGANAIYDEMTIWKRTLSPTERAMIYNFGLGCAYPFTTCAAPNMLISVHDTRTGTAVSGFSWNCTTTNASDTNPKSGYCPTTLCSITLRVKRVSRNNGIFLTKPKRLLKKVRLKKPSR